MSDLNSKVILAKGIKMDRNYNNVLSYSESDMLNLVTSESHIVASYYKFSFIKPQRSMLVNFTYAQCEQSNYLAFQNPDYDNKWFFAWIDEVIYRGDKNTEITFTIDAWSTWFSKWTAKTCYIEREHVNNDTIGANTVPENLDIGEVTCDVEVTEAAYQKENALGLISYYIAVESEYVIADGSHATLSDPGDSQGENFQDFSIYNGTVFGSLLYLFHIQTQADFGNLLLFLRRMNLDKKVESIKNMFIIPDAFIVPAELDYHTADAGPREGANPFEWYTLQYSLNATTFTHTFAKKTGFSDFTPKNNKCFCYPYNYLLVTNNSGATNVYKYEEFSSENCVFENQLAVSIGGSARIVPKDYKGAAYNYDESLPVGKFPTCAWTSDSYTNWLTQNSVNIAGGIAATVGLVGLTIATGGAAAPAAAGAAAAGAKALTVGKLVAGATMATAGATASKIGQFSEAKQLPNISGGQATGDVSFSTDSTTIVYRAMRCKNEYMQIIDDYFSRFGYAIRHLGIPNITGRSYWNYVEIGQSEEIGYGDVPSKFMETINDAARKGVTIWHSHANLGNYALTNSIV